MSKVERLREAVEVRRAMFDRGQLDYLGPNNPIWHAALAHLEQLEEEERRASFGELGPKPGPRGRLQAPWTAEQVKYINRYQAAGRMHPMTCPKHYVSLTASRLYLFCPKMFCNYTQSWVHPFMTWPTTNSV